MNIIDNKLTDRKFWADYWANKRQVGLTHITDKFLFSNSFSQAIKAAAPNSAVELGGFPGFYSIYLQKFHQVATTLFDFYINGEILDSIQVTNGLAKGTIDAIEGDLFNYTPAQKYDLVFSIGLIEHFIDTEDIIYKHMSFANSGGTIFIVIPNFTGINGWINKKFDRSNYDIHNIACMYPKVLIDAARKCGLQEIDCHYEGKFSIWIEHKDKISFFSRIILKCIWLIGKVYTKLIPLETKFFSPYIVLSAKKA